MKAVHSLLTSFLKSSYLKTKSHLSINDRHKKIWQPAIKAAALVLVATGYGCSTFQTDKLVSMPDANQGKTFHSIADITCQPLPLMPGKDTARVVINEQTARLQLPSGLTPVLAYKIPGQGLHKIAIDSFVVRHSGQSTAGSGDNELFYPEIALLNKDNVMTSKVDPHHVSYKMPGFTSEEGVGTSFTIDNRGSVADKPSCLLIYTTDDLREGTTTLTSEEKEYAKARGVVPNPGPDPVARHGNTGHLTIAMKSNGLVAVNPAIVPAVMDHQGSATQATRQFAEPASLTLDEHTREIRNHYLNGVKSALDQGNVTAALDRRAELKSVTADAEHYFLNNYGKSKAVIQSVGKNAGGSFADKARQLYKERMSDYLKQGKGSAALQLLDEVKALQADVDRLFDR